MFRMNFQSHCLGSCGHRDQHADRSGHVRPVPRDRGGAALRQAHHQVEEQPGMRTRIYYTEHEA